MQLMIWFLVYLLLILALARWRDHHDSPRTKKREQGDDASRGRPSARKLIEPPWVGGAVRHSHRRS